MNRFSVQTFGSSLFLWTCMFGIPSPSASSSQASPIPSLSASSCPELGTVRQLSWGEIQYNMKLYSVSETSLDRISNRRSLQRNTILPRLPFWDGCFEEEKEELEEEQEHKKKVLLVGHRCLPAVLSHNQHLCDRLCCSVERIQTRIIMLTPPQRLPRSPHMFFADDTSVKESHLVAGPLRTL